MTDAETAGVGPVADPDEARRESLSTQRQHLRGSTLMVGGRLVSMVLNLVVQVLTVRYLGKTDYGVFAYAVSISSLGASATLLGQDKALAKFLPRYERLDDFGRAQGAMAVAFGTVFVLGLATAASIIGLHAVGIDLTSDEAAVATMLILVAVTPFTALDAVFVSLLAVVGRPRAIFVRRHVLTPCFRLTSVLVIMATAGSVESLAWAYLITGIVGVLVYVGMVKRLVSDHALGASARRSYPFRDMWGFGGPLVVSDVVQALRATLVIVFLEALRSVDEVGAFRAVLPVAQLNLALMQSFRLLYLPAAARMFERGDRAGVVRLYWQSAAWLTVGTFPIFAATFSFAEPVTRLLFGAEFASSASILAVLSIGYYLNAALGLNALTLAASGRVRLMVAADGTTAVIALALNLSLISAHGALGAAFATSGVLVVQNLLVHIGLRRTLDGLPFPRQHRAAYGSVIVGAGALFAIQQGLDPPLGASAVVGLVVSGSVLAVNRGVLALADTIPEVRRLPVVGKYL